MSYTSEDEDFDYDKPMGNIQQIYYEPDYSMTWNLGNRQDDNYRVFETMAREKKGDELVKIRVKQLAIAKLLVRVHSRSPQMLVKAHTHLAHAYLEHKCYDQAYEHLKMAYERNNDWKLNKGGEEYHLYILRQLSQTCLESNRIKESNLFIEEGILMCRKGPKIGEKGVDFVQLLEFRGDFLLKNSRLEEAIDCYLEIHEKYEDIKGKVSEGYAHACKQLAFTYDKLERLQESQDFLNKAILSYEKGVSQNKKMNLIDLYVKKIELLGSSPVKGEDFDENILSCYVIVKNLNKELYGTRDKRTLKSLRNQALIQGKKKRFTESYETLKEVEELEVSLFGEINKHVAKTYMLQAIQLQKQDEKDNARALIKKVISIYEDLGDRESAREARDRLNFFEQREMKEKDHIISEENNYNNYNGHSNYNSRNQGY